MSLQSRSPGWWLFVRFEQGRGRGGVPKVRVPFMHVPGKPPSIETLTKMAVVLFRAICADPSNHGADLMPGRDDEYHLHNVDGGLLDATADIQWEKIDDRQQVAELVLTWRIPNEDLLGSGSGDKPPDTQFQNQKESK